MRPDMLQQARVVSKLHANTYKIEGERKWFLTDIQLHGP
jgi:hypothetical protein